MKVLVISDTHRNIQHVNPIIKMCKEKGGIKAIIHCGDNIDDAKDIQRNYPEIPVYMVPGNCDFGSMGSTSSLVEIEGVPILVTHGHRHHVKYNYEELYIDAKAHEAKLVCFGHTHCACKEKKDAIFIVNPGSLSEPRDTMYPSFALLDLEKGQVKDIEILQLTGDSRFLSHPCF